MSSFVVSVETLGLGRVRKKREERVGRKGEKGVFGYRFNRVRK